MSTVNYFIFTFFSIKIFLFNNREIINSQIMIKINFIIFRDLIKLFFYLRIHKFNGVVAKIKHMCTIASVLIIQTDLQEYFIKN